MLKKIFTKYQLGSYLLPNRLAMAPMTRCRAIDNVPNDFIAEYYAQRASAGLIITEGVSPSINGLGYARIPGIYSEAQTEGWKKVTKAVHDQGGHIFIQLMHTGRVGHPDNLPAGGQLLAPSAIAAKGQIYTDTSGMQDMPRPSAMTIEQIREAIDEHMQASVNAIQAGFDGVELHGAHGYLIEQFLNPSVNVREDQYGGSVVNRCRFALQTVASIVEAIGRDKIGIRLSPFSLNNDHAAYDRELVLETYTYLATELDKMGIAYLHLSLASELAVELIAPIRDVFHHTLIVCGNQDGESAEALLTSGRADLVAFGRPFIANPDLVKRFETGVVLNSPDPATFFTPFKEGLIDYPVYN